MDADIDFGFLMLAGEIYESRSMNCAEGILYYVHYLSLLDERFYLQGIL